MEWHTINVWELGSMEGAANLPWAGRKRQAERSRTGQARMGHANHPPGRSQSVGHPASQPTNQPFNKLRAAGLRVSHCFRLTGAHFEGAIPLAGAESSVLRATGAADGSLQLQLALRAARRQQRQTPQQFPDWNFHGVLDGIGMFVVTTRPSASFMVGGLWGEKWRGESVRALSAVHAALYLGPHSAPPQCDLQCDASTRTVCNPGRSGRSGPSKQPPRRPKFAGRSPHLKH